MATIKLGVDGVEVDKPGLEEGAGDAFQRPVHLLIEFDFVVEGAENMGDFPLLIQGWQPNLEALEGIGCQSSSTVAGFVR